MINLKKLYEEKKIVAFIGRSAAGKDTIVSALINLINSSSDYQARKVVSYTTRPQRSNEVEGVDYYFITNEEFLEIKKSGGLYEETCYSVEKDRDWYYGLGDDCFVDNNLNLVIVNPHGLRRILKSEVKLFLYLLIVLKKKESRDILEEIHLHQERLWKKELSKTTKTLRTFLN